MKKKLTVYEKRLKARRKSTWGNDMKQFFISKPTTGKSEYWQKTGMGQQ